MSTPGFEKIGRSDTSLFGPRKLLLCGFGPEAQEKFKALLEMLGLSRLALVWLSQGQSEETIGNLVGLADGTGTAHPSNLPRTVIVCGITQNELHQLMSGCRKAGMKQALWAALTPTSIHWPLKHLLAELEAERKALAARPSSGNTISKG
jgi:hypothetical protein